jgi:hypothetical protein
MLPLRLSNSWTRSIELTKVKLDYKHMRCTLGIWEPAKRRIYAAPGSTVPRIDQVRKSTLRQGRGCNQLEPGYYTDYVKGEHFKGKELGHQALRQSSPRFIRRTVRGVPYGKADRLLFSNPYDNLHCSWNPEVNKPGFNSAGCLVVAGRPYCKRLQSPESNQGPWKVFHRIIYRAVQRKFGILLLEANQVIEAISAVEKTFLCYGSKGSEVNDLQRKLRARKIYKGGLTGSLDARTYKAWSLVQFRI